ncbi:MAG: trypsin-like peptidase domain-containing protein [Planctomycetes bacterium]|nr:trypsin-like peptidase domain-containing protein [Planctomycetota bacterium]MCB9884373.1 trypsin-like peptidase domain-containing protein [Planctomycetota bacterium]
MHQLLSVLCCLGSLAAQTRDYGKAYSFAERKPVSKVEKVIDGLLPSIVKVHGASGVRTIQAYGTGIIVSKQGHILTLDQVMIQKDRTRVVLHDGSVHQAQLLPEDPALGVRLLKIDPSEVDGELRAVWPPADTEGLGHTGQFVVSLGNCFRLAEFSEKVSATFGVVVGRADTALRYRMSDVKYDGELILTDACNNPGHYGGGLFTLDGRWLGLNMRLLDSTETNTMVSAAIPSTDLLPYLDEYINGKPRQEEAKANPPVWTGIVLFDSAGQRSPPAYVERIVKESPAAKLGLRPDDLIVRIDDYSIRTCREFRDILTKYAPGQTVTLTYKRGTKVQQGALTLAAEPAK